MTFDDTWNRIVALAGQEFRTVTGLAFTYAVSGNAIVPSRAEQSIGRGEFEKYRDAERAGKTASEINKLVRGSSYVRAILEDERIR